MVFVRTLHDQTENEQNDTHPFQNWYELLDF